MFNRVLICMTISGLYSILIGCDGNSNGEVSEESTVSLSTSQYCADTLPYNDGNGDIYSTESATLSTETCPLSIVFEDPVQLDLSGFIEDGEGCCGTVALDENIMVLGARRAYYTQITSDTRPLVVMEQDSSNIFQFTNTLHEGRNTGEIAINGDWLVASNVTSNEVYVYQRQQPGVWSEQRIVPNEAVADSSFGHAIAIEGGKLVISAINRFDDAAATAVYLYELDDEQKWVNTAKLHPTNSDYQDVFFGLDVDVSGDSVIVGAPTRTRRQRDAPGRAYLFEKGNEGSWSESILIPENGEQLNNSNSPGTDSYGSAVAIENGQIAVAAPLAGSGEGYAPGIVFLFRKGKQNDWSVNKVIPSNHETGSSNRVTTFGRRVSINDDVLVVGSAGATESGGVNNSVYLYSLNSGVASSETIVHNPDTSHSYGDYFAYSSKLLVVPRMGRFSTDYEPQINIYKRQ